MNIKEIIARPFIRYIQVPKRNRKCHVFAFFQVPKLVVVTDIFL